MLGFMPGFMLASVSSDGWKERRKEKEKEKEEQTDKIREPLTEVRE